MRAGAWFRNRSVRVKVLSAVLVGLLALLIVGTYGVVALKNVDGRATSLFTHAVKPYENLADLRDMEGDTRFEIRDYVAASSADARTTLRADMAVTDKQLNGDIASYLRMAGNGQEARSAMMVDFRTRLAAFRQVRDQQVLPAADAGNSSHAYALLDGPLSVADDAMGAPMDSLLAAEDAAAAAQAKAAAHTYSMARTLLLSLLIIGVLAAAALGLVVARGIARPVAAVRAVLERMSRGDLTGEVAVTSRDEIGVMGEALNTAITTLRRTVETLSRSAAAVAESSGGLTDVSRKIGGSAEELTAQSILASGAAEQVSANVASIAGSAEEMGASIREIAQSASAAAAVASGAVSAAQSATGTMADLADSSAQISAVLSVILTVAEQTKLLALNATIEAARAGDAGAGFAVVASEIKELARETAAATEEISTLVETIRLGSDGAVAAIAEVSSVIDKISTYATTIAAAVEQQTATTADMARSVAEAAVGAQQIAASIHDVAGAASTTSLAVADNQAAADGLLTMSGDLSDLVAQFTVV
ncbi:hypothetical protein acdb102_35560 [Acidothermaceae bacterium B102]|nr:hypothetical protein acdb102_35560 [Acidothermaceae bacterium B102]